MPYKSKIKKAESNKKWEQKNKQWRSAYEKKWREKNREKYLAQRKKSYQENREERGKKARDYYYAVRQPDRRNNPKKYKEIDRLWAQKRREKFRALFLELKREMGGRCSQCGYNKHLVVLHFHHVINKLANVSELKSFKKIREEAKKCILLCPNCHMELTFVK